MRPLTLWTAMGLVVSFALMLTLVRAIERDVHGGQANILRESAEIWAKMAERAEASGDGLKAKEARDYEASLLVRSHRHAAELKGFPRSLAGLSLFVIVLYTWAVTFFLVLRAEQPGPPLRDPWNWPIQFRLWTVGNTIGPLATIALAGAFQANYHGPGSEPWGLVYLIEGLFWSHLVFVLAGIVYFRGRRSLAAIFGIPSAFATWLFMFLILAPILIFGDI